MRKVELRQSCLSRQKAISADDRTAKIEAITDLFFETFDLEPIKCLHTFLPIEKFNEVDTRLILDRVWHDYRHVQTVVPRVDFVTNEITSVKFGPAVELARNSWDIDEPTHNDLVDPAEIDMVLAPGICFDRDLHRVGYGKGFYDRFLKRCRPDCVKIGLSYFEPVEKIDDVHEGDVRLDHLVTPHSMYSAKR